MKLLNLAKSAVILTGLGLTVLVLKSIGATFSESGELDGQTDTPKPKKAKMRYYCPDCCAWKNLMLSNELVDWLNEGNHTKFNCDCGTVMRLSRKKVVNYQHYLDIHFFRYLLDNRDIIEEVNGQS